MGYAEGLTNLGICHLYGKGTKKDLQVAKSLFKEASDKNSVSGRYYLAFFKMKEATLSQDPKTY